MANIRYVRRVVFSTDDSAVPVTITWADPLTEAELTEVKEFVALWLKGLERRSSLETLPALCAKSHDGKHAMIDTTDGEKYCGWCDLPTPQNRGA